MKDSPERKSLHGFLFLLIFSVVLSIPALRGWPFPWLVSLGAYLSIAMASPALRKSFPRWYFGKITRFSVALAGSLSLLSFFALNIFHSKFHPDVSSYGFLLPVHKLGGILAAGIIFSISNAIFEEIVFRRIFFDAIESERGSLIAVITTSMLFGYGHLHGYPPGLLGGLLAGIYGFALGCLRRITGGIGLCIIAHIIADATIFTILLRSNAF